MGVINALFENAFFDLPFLEALTWIAVALCLGAAIVGFGRRLVDRFHRHTDQPRSAFDAGSRPLGRAA